MKKGIKPPIKNRAFIRKKYLVLFGILIIPPFLLFVKCFLINIKALTITINSYTVSAFALFAFILAFVFCAYLRNSTSVHPK